MSPAPFLDRLHCLPERDRLGDDPVRGKVKALLLVEDQRGAAVRAEHGDRLLPRPDVGVARRADDRAVRELRELPYLGRDCPPFKRNGKLRHVAHDRNAAAAVRAGKALPLRIPFHEPAAAAALKAFHDESSRTVKSGPGLRDRGQNAGRAMPDREIIGDQGPACNLWMP